MNDERKVKIMSDIINFYENLLKDEDVKANNSFDYTLGYLIRKNYGKEIIELEKENDDD